jgi:hypothetical protein
MSAKKHSFNFLVFTLTLSIFSAFSVRAALSEQWSIENDKQHPPVAASNRIIKWCQDKGNKTRYASANLKIKGFSPCGAISPSITCDPSGNRMIGSGERPRAHKDCAVGPRIVIINHDSSDIVDTQNLASSSEDIKPLSSKERSDFSRALKESQRKQNQQYVDQMREVTKLLMSGLLGVDSSPYTFNNTKRPKSKYERRREQRKAKKQLKEMLKQLDPASRKALEGMLNAAP